MLDVITVGSASRDVFVKSGALDIQESDTEPHVLEACFPLGAKIDIDELVFETGGGATNAAATLARLGFGVAAVCTVGQDANGRDVVEALVEDGISDRFVQRHPTGQTAYSIIIVAGSGERTILVHRGAARKTDADAVPWSELEAKWFYISSLGGDEALLERILEKAAAIGAKVAWNPGNAELKLGLDRLERYIRQVDVFNLNREEAATLTACDRSDLACIIGSLRELPKRVLLVTDGLGGTYSVEGQETLHTDVIDVPRVNTTGAGDSFGSGFVAGLIRRDDVPYALAVGTCNAAGLVQEMGAKRGLLNAFPDEESLAKVKIEPWN
ncbi:carbohydrate kinase family protein [Patescibacteria group bacterium]